MRVLVTSANGFIGRYLVPSLLERGYAVRGTVRIAQASVALGLMPAADIVTLEDIGPETNWNNTLDGVDAVIHLAGRAHILHDSANDPFSEFRKVNVQGTERLARQAASAGVTRFVYVSSIGVNGEITGSDYPTGFSELHAPNPHNAYSRSKWEAEQTLKRVAEETNLEVVIVRPPLVYGPGVPGNLFRMLQWTYKALPLPIAGAESRKSLIGVDNLADFLCITAIAPKAANQTFVIGDGEDVSTAELIRRLAGAMNRPVRLFHVPENLLNLAARLTGNEKAMTRLFGSLVVDSRKAVDLLGWHPPVTLDAGLSRTAAWYLDRYARTGGKRQ